MSNVFVVDTNKTPLDPVHPGYARKLLNEKRAAVLLRFPFTIILKVAIETPIVRPLRVKINPGSKNSGIAVVNDGSGQVMFAAEVQHHGTTIKQSLEDRRAIRRSRRNRKTRYRKARFLNRTKPRGWLPPSLMSRIANVTTWVRRLQRLCPIGAISQQVVKFDTNLLNDPNSLEYQQGELAGYEVREYLLEKWQRTCAYCGKKDVPLQIDHIHPLSQGGKHLISNLTLACDTCNKAKGSLDIKEFLRKKPELAKKILAQAKAPLKDPTAMNATRWELYRRLEAFDLPLEAGSGGRTKYNRTKRDLPRSSWINAACVGASTPEVLDIRVVNPLQIKSMGHGTRQMCQTDKYGFPKQHRKRQKKYYGFQTGDMVRALIPKGKYAGMHVGRVTVRSTGQFKIKAHGQDIPCPQRYCVAIQRHDGYQYSFLK